MEQQEFNNQEPLEPKTPARAKYLVKADEFELEGLLGKGAQGEIWRATWLKKKQTVVVKMMPVTDGNRGREFNKEKQILSTCQHPNLMSLLAWVEHDAKRPGYQWLVMEQMPYKSLDKFLTWNKGSALPWLERIHLSQDLIAGLEYLHRHNILHRDIKSGNILLAESSNPQRQYIAKFTDFGIARIGTAAVTQSLVCSGVVGTYSYLSPELRPWLEQQKPTTKPPYSEGSDIYALGVVYWEIAAWQFIASYNYNGRFSFALDQAVSPEYRKLVHGCLAKDVKQRPLSGLIYKKLHDDKFMRDICNYAVVSEQTIKIADSSAELKLGKQEKVVIDYGDLRNIVVQQNNSWQKLNNLFSTAKQNRSELEVRLLNFAAALKTQHNNQLLHNALQLGFDSARLILANPRLTKQCDIEQQTILISQCTSLASLALANDKWLEFAPLLHKFISYYWPILSTVNKISFVDCLVAAHLINHNKLGHLATNNISLPKWLISLLTDVHSMYLERAKAVKPQLAKHHQLIMFSFAVSLRYDFWLQANKTAAQHRIYSGIALLDSILACSRQLEVAEYQQFKQSLKMVALQISQSLVADFKLVLEKAAAKSLSDYCNQLSQLAYCMSRLFALELAPEIIKPLFLVTETIFAGFLHQAKQVEHAKEIDRNNHYGATAERLLAPLLGVLPYAPKDWLALFCHSVAIIAVSDKSRVTTFESVEFENQKLDIWDKTGKLKLTDIKPAAEPIVEHCAEFAVNRLILENFHPSHNAKASHKKNNKLSREQLYQRLSSSQYTQQRIEQFKHLLDKLLPLLGPAPCNVQVLGLGSLARGRLLAYSNLNIAILVEDKQFIAHPWLRAYVNLLDIVTRVLDNHWTWLGKASDSTGKLAVTGHHIADIEHLIYNQQSAAKLLNTPAALAKWVINSLAAEEPSFTADKKKAYSLLHCIALTACEHQITTSKSRLSYIMLLLISLKSGYQV